MKRNPVLIVVATAAVLGILFAVVLALASRLAGGKRIGVSLAGSGAVAVVKIEGLLVTSDRIVDELNDYADDGSVKAVVVRIDSPGGGVVASQEIYNAIKKIRKDGKKVVASMGTVAASGGYYIAAAADRIVANPGSLTGSIGVKMEFASVEKLLEKIGVKGMVVKAGEYKDMGSPLREMTRQEKELLQGVIDDVHDQFIDAVAKGRAIPVDDIRSIADGRIFTGRQALKLKLVDQMGDLADSIRLAGTLAGIKGEPAVIEKKKKIPLLDYFKEEAAAWIGDVLVNAVNHNTPTLQYR